MDAQTIIILLAIGIPVGILILRFIISAGLNKADDAIRNAASKSKSENTPLEKTNLSDLYGTQDKQ